MDKAGKARQTSTLTPASIIFFLPDASICVLMAGSSQAFMIVLSIDLLLGNILMRSGKMGPNPPNTCKVGMVGTFNILIALEKARRLFFSVKGSILFTFTNRPG